MTRPQIIRAGWSSHQARKGSFEARGRLTVSQTPLIYRTKKLHQQRTIRDIQLRRQRGLPHHIRPKLYEKLQQRPTNSRREVRAYRTNGRTSTKAVKTTQIIRPLQNERKMEALQKIRPRTRRWRMQKGMMAWRMTMI